MAETVSSFAVAEASARASSASHAERFAPILAGLAVAAPTLIARYPPMSDLPLHEGAVGLLRHFGDPAYMPPNLYVLNLGQPNQLFHLVACALSYAVGTDWAVKIVIAAAQFLVFFCGAKLADHLGRSRWSALLLAPLALGFTYYWGLVTNLVGFAAFLFALPVIDRAATRPSPSRVLRACGVMLLLYFAHESSCAAAAAVAGFFAAFHRLSPRKTALRLVPPAFAALIAVGQLWVQARHPMSEKLTPPATFFPLKQRLHNLPNVLFGSHELTAQVLIFGLSVAAIVLFVAPRVQRWGARQRRGADEAHQASRRFDRARAWVLLHRFEVMAGFFFVAYLVLPYNWNGATLVHERFLGPAWAIFVLCATPRARVPRVGKLAAAVVPLAVLLIGWPQFQSSDKAFRELDPILARIPQNRAVTLLVLNRPIHHERVYSAGVGPARVLAVKGGRMGLALAYSPIAPVRMRPEYRWADYALRTIISGSMSMVPSYDLRKFEWVIVESREADTRRAITLAFSFGPDAELVMESGEWMLFHSKYDVAPLESADLPAPKGAQTMVDRVTMIQHAHLPGLENLEVPSRR